MSDLPVLSSPSQLRTVKLARELVQVPEWGVSVWVWEMTGAEVESWRQSLMRKGKVELNPRAQRERTARLLCRVIRDEQGNRMYSDHDAAMFMDMGSAGMERVAEVALRLSGLSRAADDRDDDEDDGEDEATGNSGAAPSGSSTSTSPSLSDGQ